MCIYVCILRTLYTVCTDNNGNKQKPGLFWSLSDDFNLNTLKKKKV